jgi:hypothetical protein
MVAVDSVERKKEWSRQNLDGRKMTSVYNAIFQLPRDKCMFAVGCDQACLVGNGFKNSTASSSRKAVYPKQAFSPCCVSIPFAKD